MPGLEDLLGKKDSKKEEPMADPMEATPDGAKPGENPLEKIDEASKATPNKKDSGSKTLDPDVIETMLKTGDSVDGMFTPNEKKEEGDPKHQEEVDEKAKVKVGSKVEPQGKYKDMFKNDMLKNPTKYKVNTPKGEMTVAEAIRKGYNPLTKTFDKAHDMDAIKEEELSKLNDTDRARIEELTSPSAAQVAPADAGKYGLEAGSPMIRQPEQPMMPGAMPPEQGMPQGGMPMPQASPEAGAPQGMDIAAMLGGQ